MEICEMTEAEKIADIEDFLTRTMKKCRVKKISHRIEPEPEPEHEIFSESEKDALIDTISRENIEFLRQNKALKKELLELENKLMIFERNNR